MLPWRTQFHAAWCKSFDSTSLERNRNYLKYEIIISNKANYSKRRGFVIVARQQQNGNESSWSGNNWIIVIPHLIVRELSSERRSMTYIPLRWSQKMNESKGKCLCYLRRDLTECRNGKLTEKKSERNVSSDSTRSGHESEEKSSALHWFGGGEEWTLRPCQSLEISFFVVPR